MSAVNIARVTLAWKYPNQRNVHPHNELWNDNVKSPVQESVGLDQISEEPSKDALPHETEPLRTEDLYGLEPIQEEKDHESKVEWFLNIKAYVLVLTLVGVCLSMDNMLRLAMITTLQRRFGFETSEMGLIISSFDIGHVGLLLLLSYAGAKVHKPKVCAFGGFLAAISGVLWAMPHFLYGSGLRPLGAVDNGTVVDPSLGLCSASSGAGNGLSCEALGNGTEVVEALPEAEPSFWIFFVSQALLGSSLAPLLTVGITYLDDNTDPQTSGAGVAILMSVSSMGLVFGFLLGAVTTGVPADLKATSLTPADPEWIGAWWLGSICIAGLIFVFTIPLCAFPRHIKIRKSNIARNSIKMRKHMDNNAETDALKLRPLLQRTCSEIKEPHLKDLPKESKSLLTNVTYLSVTLASCCLTILPAGVFTYMPKYLETQFQATSMLANVITAIVSALAMAIGTFVGGWIAAAKELTPKGMARMVFVSSFLGIVCFAVSMLLGCDEPNIAGSIDAAGYLNISLPCSQDCNCGIDFLPVCGADNVNYFSACQAGCSSLSPDQTTLSNCSCVGDMLTGAGPARSAAYGLCDSSCITLIPYSAIMFLCGFFLAIGISPTMSILIRCVDKEKKAFALGITNLLTSVLASIPAPILYGLFIDKTCKVKAMTCEGAILCLAYDNAMFRYLLHGITLGAVVLAELLLGVTYYQLTHEEKQGTYDVRVSLS